MNTIKNILEIADKLNAVSIRETENWIMLSCPFALKKHKKGTDNNPSFGINKRFPFMYNCFSCGEKGYLRLLPTRLEQLNIKFDVNIHKLISILYSFKNVTTFIEKPQQKQEKIIIQRVNFKFNLNKFIKINRWGKINKETIDRFKIRYDKEKDRLILPVFDEVGVMRAVWSYYLKTRKKIEMIDEHKISCKKQGLFYGLHLIDITKPVFLVEGHRDAILLQQEKINAMALFGVNMSKEQYQKIKDLNLDIILMFDNDKAGKTSAETLRKKYGFKQATFFGAKDPAELVEKDIIKKFLKNT